MGVFATTLLCSGKEKSKAITHLCKESLTATQTHKMDIGIEQMGRYISPVNPNIYPHLTLILLGIGIFFTAWFFVYEVTSTKYSRDIYKELLVALFAAIFMGF